MAMLRILSIERRSFEGEKRAEYRGTPLARQMRTRIVHTNGRDNAVKADRTLTHVRVIDSSGRFNAEPGSSRDASIYGDGAIPNILGPSRNKRVHSNTPVHGRNKGDRKRRQRSPPH